MNKKYDSYKNSNIPWIGNIPEHWKVLHLKNVINYETGNTPDTRKDYHFKGSEGFDWVNISDLKNRIIYKAEKKITESGVESKKMKIVPKGSLLFSFKLSVGKCSFINKDMYTNEAIASFQENKYMSINFLYYLLQEGFKENGRKNIYGAYIMNRSLIENALIAIPEKNEQDAIANYLDDKVGSLDKLIPAIDDQIENFKDLRLSLIKETISESSNYKNRIKNIVNFSKGVAVDVIEKHKVESIPLLSLSYLRGGKCEFVLKQKNIKMAYENDFLVIWDGSSSGEIIRAKYGALSSTVAKVIIKDKKKVDENYLFYAMKSKESHIQMLSNGMGIPHVDRNVLNEVVIPLPDIEKQKEIAKQLDERISNIDNAIIALKEQKQNMIDYKKALIHDVVTGKIKVYEEE